MNEFFLLLYLSLKKGFLLLFVCFGTEAILINYCLFVLAQAIIIIDNNKLKTINLIKKKLLINFNKNNIKKIIINIGSANNNNIFFFGPRASLSANPLACASARGSTYAHAGTW